MHEVAASLLAKRQYQDDLHTPEKHLFYLAMETLIYEKRRNIGMLNAQAYSFTPQTSEETLQKSEELPQNVDQYHPTDTTPETNENIVKEQHCNEQKKPDEEWIQVTKGCKLHRPVTLK